MRSDELKQDGRVTLEFLGLPAQKIMGRDGVSGAMGTPHTRKAQEIESQIGLLSDNRSRNPFFVLLRVKKDIASVSAPDRDRRLPRFRRAKAAHRPPLALQGRDLEL